MSSEQVAAVARDDAPRRGSGYVWVLFVLFVLGLASLLYGLSSTNAQPDLALMTVSFLVLMSVSQAGVVFCAVMRLVGAQWAKPYYRLASLSTIAFAPLAILGFLLIFLVASEDLFYWLEPPADEHLSAWLNINWLLVRNLVGLLLFYALSVVYVIKSLKPDLESAAEADNRKVERELYLLSPWVLVAFVVCNTLFAWDFAMMLISHWHSTVFPIYYWFGSAFAGTAALALFPAVLGYSAADDLPFGPDQIRSLGMVVTGFTLLWLYFFWAQFFVVWFGNLPVETEALWRQMYGHYGRYFWTMMAGCFFIPFVTLIFAVVKRSVAAMCFIGVGINLGNWLSKYLMILPALSPDHQPFSSAIDIAIAVGLLAGFLLLLVLLARRVPIYSHWEMALKPTPRS